MAAILLGFAAAVVGLIVGLTLLNGDDPAPPRRADRGQTVHRQRQAAGEAEDHPGAKVNLHSHPGAQALNDQGFQLLSAGRYNEAIPVLERAVRAFPAGSSDLNLAYALYNLGRSLRLALRSWNPWSLRARPEVGVEVDFGAGVVFGSAGASMDGLPAVGLRGGAVVPIEQRQPHDQSTSRCKPSRSPGRRRAASWTLDRGARKPDIRKKRSALAGPVRTRQQVSPPPPRPR